MKTYLWLLGAALVLIGFFLPHERNAGLFGAPIAAIGSICSLVGVGLILYSVFVMRSKTPPNSGKQEKE